jgi:CDP-6-deoxy-D-xylo-4-hexulose-3-dehydrase
LNKISRLLQQHFENSREEFIPGKTKISIASPTYGFAEVNEALDSLLSTWVTMGKKVKKFENSFARYIGSKYSVMVNSGSSANLLALSILTNPKFSKRIKLGSEVLTPAVTWATTIFPIANVNLVPSFIDVDLENFNLDVDKLRKSITKKTKAILLVHLLGNPANMKEIIDIAKEYNLFVIEDSCEAHGAEFNNKKIGSFGDISTFSFFLSHHISTIEGGMLLTKNEEIFELAKAMRAFGWIRDQKNKKQTAKKNPKLDPRFLFDNLGYNIRPTEIQGSFGIHQIKKLEKFIKIRTNNANFWNKKLEKFSNYLLLHSERPNTRHVWFAYPITVRSSSPFSRNQLVNFLEKKNIETRPIMASDITQQPAIKLIKKKINKPLTNSKFIHSNSFFIGVHQGIGKSQRNYVVSVFDEFMKRWI